MDKKNVTRPIFCVSMVLLIIGGVKTLDIVNDRILIDTFCYSISPIIFICPFSLRVSHFMRLCIFRTGLNDTDMQKEVMTKKYFETGFILFVFAILTPLLLHTSAMRGYFKVNSWLQLSCCPAVSAGIVFLTLNIAV